MGGNSKKKDQRKNEKIERKARCPSMWHASSVKAGKLIALKTPPFSSPREEQEGRGRARGARAAVHHYRLPTIFAVKHVDIRPVLCLRPRSDGLSFS